jgi:osmoprotectant transport system ATP-binding protein
LITFERVTKRYPDGTVAVHALDLVVPAGQTMVLVGPSGCGKTTSLRMINRLIEPTEGRILLDGQDVRKQDPARLRREIGYVIQQAGLFPHRTVQDNIATVPVLVGTRRAAARARAREMLALVGLDQELATRYPHQLSGGQQQRVGVARALAADPPVLLMDEPFSAVDPVVRTSLQEELIALQAQLHKTIVLVTHDIEEAIKVGDRIALFHPHGTIAQVGPPERLLAAPADSYVADFVGFDRGIRRLSFVAAGGLPLDGRQVLDAAITVQQARAREQGQHWLLVTEGGRPAGWVPVGGLAALPADTPLSQVPAEGFGHAFTVGTDSLRVALDAAVLSPAGLAIGVDGDGRVLGLASFEDLRAAITAASQRDTASQQVAPAAEAAPPPEESLPQEDTLPYEETASQEEAAGERPAVASQEDSQPASSAGAAP